MDFRNASRSGWNPWTELSRLQAELDRLFTNGARGAPAEFPPIDVWSGEQGLRVFAQLAGFEPDEIDLSVVGETLTLKGERRTESEDGGSWHRRERGPERFVRTVELPFPIDADAVKASFRNGLLEIELPRAASSKPRKIKVDAS